MSTYKDYVDATQQEFANPTSNKIESNKYNIKLTRYPSDLGANDLKHFVLFNINVRGKSKIDESKRLFEIKRDPNTANLSKEQLSSNGIRIPAIAAGAAGAGLAVTSLVNQAKGSIAKSGTKLDKVLSVGGTVAGGVAAGAIGTAMAKSDILKPDTTYRITDAVALHIDAPPTVKYSMNYANKDLGTLLGVLSGNAFDSAGAFKGTQEAGAAIGASLARLPGAFGAADVSSALGVASGTSLNPFKEVVFESVDFRTFAFKYKFYPKSQQESDHVYNIIKLFKEHMHPQMSDGKLFFIYPSEFQITYYFDDKPNTYFHRFRPCALESLDVSYGGDQFSTFSDGKPTEIHLNLTFKELEILTRNNIRDGY